MNKIKLVGGASTKWIIVDNVVFGIHSYIMYSELHKWSKQSFCFDAMFLKFQKHPPQKMKSIIKGSTAVLCGLSMISLCVLSCPPTDMQVNWWTGNSK